MIQFISHYTDQISYLDSVRLALEGGCRWIQLRMKNATDDEVRLTALKVQNMCRECGATLIIDDRVWIAKEVHADGVHLGKTDMSLREAREILGKDFIIGATANTFEDIAEHFKNGADYIGCGPFRFTTTKQGLAPVLGLEGLRSIVSRMRDEGIFLPIVAIGGITREDVPGILSTGVTGIALSGSVLRADDPVEEMRQFVNLCSADKNSGVISASGAV